MTPPGYTGCRFSVALNPEAGASAVGGSLKDLVWIQTFPNEVDASHAAELLRAKGIEPFVSANPLHGIEPATPTARSVWLGVRAVDVRTALTLIWTQSAP